MTGHAHISNAYANHANDSAPITDHSGETLLHKAVITCDIQIVDLLLEYNADPNARNHFGETPFLLSCRTGHLQIMNLLLRCNANPKLVDQAGMGPIHHAARSGNV